MPFFRFSSHRSRSTSYRCRNSSTCRSRSISLKFALQLTMWPFCLFMHNNICQAFHKQLHQCSSIGAREAERAIQRRRRRRRRRCVESCCTVRTWYTKDRTHHPPVLVLKTPFVHTIAPPRQSGRLLWPKHEGFSLLTALMLQLLATKSTDSIKKIFFNQSAHS